MQSRTDELSVYSDAKADSSDIMMAVKFLNSMFTPQTNDAFLAMFSQQVVETGMTKEQLSDAVKLLARTNKYNSWKIADIIGYSAKIKTYTQNEVYRATGQHPSPLFPLVSLGGRNVTVSLSDALNYHLKVVRDYSEYK